MSEGPELDLTTRVWLRIGLGPQRDVPPLHRLTGPLERARLSLVTSGGLVPPGAPPFMTGKLGDASFREISRTIDRARLEIHHPHYDHEVARRDMSTVFPLERCEELVREGELGELAPTHYSFMGYVPVTRKLERTFAPAVAQRMTEEEVDVALLTPV